MILARRFNLSVNTSITIGIDVNERLNTEVKVILHNKNDFKITLTNEALSNLFQDNLRRRLKDYFDKKSDDTTPVELDPVTLLTFCEIYDKLGIAIHNNVSNFKICFLMFTWENLSNLKHLINCITSQLETTRRVSIEKGIVKIKEVFQSFYYSSHKDPSVLRKILKSNEIDHNDVIELELTILCYKRFLGVLDIEKNNADSIVQ